MVNKTQRNKTSISFGLALVPIILLVVLLITTALFLSEFDNPIGNTQTTLLTSALVAALIGIRFNVKVSQIITSIIASLKQTSEALIILLLIGALTGTWLMAGIIPAFFHYGLMILDASYFLVASCIFCAILALSTGTSWGTVGIIGTSLIGIGNGLGVETGWTVGAIISGAYFGDKLSPLSDTTNLAPTVAGTDLITHIKYMTITTIPSITISLVVFFIVGYMGSNDTQINDIASKATDIAITNIFNINLYLFLVPLVVISLMAFKLSAKFSLSIGVILGAITAVIFQPEVVKEIGNTVDADFPVQILASAKAIFISTKYLTEDAGAKELLASGGVWGMMDTLWLIVCAITFGAVLQVTGILNKITEILISGVNSTFGLISCTAGTSIAMNVLASDQYIAIVVPGKMYEQAFKDQRLAPENLSRTLEDAGTVTSVLIPWNTCGAFHSKTLGFDPMMFLTYTPYCLFNWISPIMTLIVAASGYKIRGIK